jgi:biotin synthase
VSFGNDLDNVRTYAFQTWGCPNCNRPYYNEIPGKVIYNHPNKIDPTLLPRLLSEADMKG